MNDKNWITSKEARIKSLAKRVRAKTIFEHGATRGLATAIQLAPDEVALNDLRNQIYQSAVPMHLHNQLIDYVEQCRRFLVAPKCESGNWSDSSTYGT